MSRTLYILISLQVLSSCMQRANKVLKNCRSLFHALVTGTWLPASSRLMQAGPLVQHASVTHAMEVLIALKLFLNASSTWTSESLLAMLFPVAAAECCGFFAAEVPSCCFQAILLVVVVRSLAICFWREKEPGRWWILQWWPNNVRGLLAGQWRKQHYRDPGVAKNELLCAQPAGVVHGAWAGRANQSIARNCRECHHWRPPYCGGHWLDTAVSSSVVRSELARGTNKTHQCRFCSSLLLCKQASSTSLL